MALAPTRRTRLHSSFAQIPLLNADNGPLPDVNQLFDTQRFRDQGTHLLLESWMALWYAEHSDFVFRVVARKPNPLLALNGFQNHVDICSKIIGNFDDRTVDFVLHNDDYATSSLERWAYPHRSQIIQVPAITLDGALAGWERLDLMKIDAEALVGNGMQQTVKRFLHAAVLVECTSSATRRRSGASSTSLSATATASAS